MKNVTLLPSGALSQNMIVLCVSVIFYFGIGINNAVAHEIKTRLPLGDGKISSAPKVGYVFACSTRFGGGGAFRVGEWIKDGSWDPASKPVVEGSVNWPNAAISISREGSQRIIKANNLPNHPSGVYPVSAGTTAYSYDRNPNSIRERDILLRLPAEPIIATQAGCIPMGMVGFAISGAAIFNAFDAQGRDAPAYEIQDSCNGHPERSGSYHYHDWSPCLGKDASGKAYPANTPVGWMLDGFPILGPIDEQGKVVTNADLDECHGRTGLVLIDGQIKQTYHYRFTREYPYTIGCFKAAR
jgi:YHYH protein